MVIFNSYVKLPEGSAQHSVCWVNLEPLWRLPLPRSSIFIHPIEGHFLARIGGIWLGWFDHSWTMSRILWFRKRRIWVFGWVTSKVFNNCPFQRFSVCVPSYLAHSAAGQFCLGAFHVSPPLDFRPWSLRFWRRWRSSVLRQLPTEAWAPPPTQWRWRTTCSMMCRDDVSLPKVWLITQEMATMARCWADVIQPVCQARPNFHLYNTTRIRPPI